MSKRDLITQALRDAPAPAAVTPGARPGPMSFVARAGQQAANGLAAENERLKAERIHGGVILELDPKDIQHSKFINRHTLSLQLEDAEFHALLESFQRDGQDQEIVVRPTPGHPQGDSKPYEIGFGHRRHGVAMLLDAQTPGGWKIKARVKPLTDRELVELMDRENALHKGLSAFEQGWQFKTALEHGVYASQAQIASVKGLTEATITKYLQVANLPQQIVDAFRDPREIRLNWIQDLVRLLNQNREEVLEVARQVRTNEPAASAEQVFAALLRGLAPTSRSKVSPPDEKTFRVPGSNAVAFRTIARGDSLRFKWGQGTDTRFRSEFAEALKRYASELLREKPPQITSKLKRKRNKP